MACERTNIRYNNPLIVFRRWSRFVVLDALRVASVQHRSSLFGVRPENRSKYDGKPGSVQTQTNNAVLQSFPNELQCFFIVQGQLCIILITIVHNVLSYYTWTRELMEVSLQYIAIQLFHVKYNSIIITFRTSPYHRICKISVDALLKLSVIVLSVHNCYCILYKLVRFNSKNLNERTIDNIVHS